MFDVDANCLRAVSTLAYSTSQQYSLRCACIVLELGHENMMNAMMIFEHSYITARLISSTLISHGACDNLESNLAYLSAVALGVFSHPEYT